MEAKGKIRKLGKKAIVSILVLMMIAGSVKAGNITIFQDTDSMETHYAETTIAYNDVNIPFLAWSAPAMDGYLLNGETKYKQQSKNSNNFSRFYGQFQTTGIQVGQPAWWKPVVNNSDGVFDDKIIIFKVYDAIVDVNDSASIPITSFDPIYESTQHTATFGWFQSGSFESQTSGIYAQLVYEVYNHSDLNRDKKVNFEDYAILVNEFGKNNTTDSERFGEYVGSNPADLGAYADIDRLGTVDINDLSAFCSEYLFVYE